MSDAVRKTKAKDKPETPVDKCQLCPIGEFKGEQEIGVKLSGGWKNVVNDPLAPFFPDRYAFNDVVVVGDAPNPHDLFAKRIFAQTYTNIKNDFFMNGVDAKKMAFFPAVECYVPKKQIDKKSETQVLKACRDDLVSHILSRRPRLIIAMGDYALRQVLKTSGITTKRGSLTYSKEFNAWVFPMFHPAMVQIDESKRVLWNADVAQVAQFINRGFVPKKASEAGEYSDVESIRFILDKQNIEVALDTETQGAEWADPNSIVISYSITDEVGKGYNIWLHKEVGEGEEYDFKIQWNRKVGRKWEVQDVYVKRDPNYEQKVAELREVCEREDIQIVMMNGNYDLHRFRQLGIDRASVKGYRLDIQTGAHTLDPDNFKKASMLNIQRAYMPDRLDHKSVFGEEGDKSDMLASAKNNPEAFTNYSSADADSTLALGQIIKKQLSNDPYRARYYTRMAHPVQSEVCYEIEKNGICFDSEKLPAVKEKVAKFLMTKSQEFLGKVPAAVLDKHRKKGLKLSRNDFIRDVFFTKDGWDLQPIEQTDTGAAAIGRKLLVRLRDDLEDGHPAKEALSTYIEWGPYNKLYSTYLKGFGEAVCADGRLHPTLSKVSTATARTSSARPNLQNIPKRNQVVSKAIRRLMVAPPGYALVAADASQAELRYITHESRDPVMMEVYKTGGDIHTRTAQKIIELDGRDIEAITAPELKDYRTKAKSVNFGYCLKRGTLITTQSGLIRIENIKVGDYVLTHNNRYMPVTELQRPMTEGLYFIVTKRCGSVMGAVHCTRDHHMLVWANGVHSWVAASDIRVGMFLVSGDRHGFFGNFEEVVSVRFERTCEEVYDFTVEEDHSFVANGLISHNCFGMRAKKFQAYARDEYGVRITVEEAEKFRLAFFDLYKGLLPWHEQKIAFAVANGFTRSPFGFTRLTPNINSDDFMKRGEDERVAINTSIQSASNDTVLIAAWAMMKKRMYDPSKAFLSLFIHDELIFTVKEDYVEEFTPILLYAMENPPLKQLFDFELCVPLVADAKYGPNLAEMVEYKRE